MHQTRGARRSLSAGAVCALALVAGAAAIGSQQRFIGYAAVAPLIGELGDRVPDTVRAIPADADAIWSAWIAQRDRDIRERLVEGDEDTILNWFLLGTSFTSEPPLVLDASAVTDEVVLRQTAVRIATRMGDLMRALRMPGTDDRRLFARELLRRHGFDVATQAGVAAAQEYLLARLEKLLLQWTALDRQAAPEFADRGLSLDTSLQPNYAVDVALAALQAEGRLAPGSIRRVGVIGAGLDFADKNSGFDFYPPQTVQPFALIDSLRRLNLAPRTGNVDVVALDISPRVLDHITRAHAGAGRGRGYTIQLPLDRRRPWTPGFRDYWKTFGARIGMPLATAATPRGAGDAEVRAIRVPPATVSRVSAADFNAITQRLDGSPFDLIVATNVLVYYEAFEQALALVNIEAMLAPGGIFLTNTTTLPDLQRPALRRGGSAQARYTDDGVGDEVIWYQRSVGIAGR